MHRSALLRTFSLHGVALTHSPLQHFFNVLCFKAQLEESRGPLSSNDIAALYMSVEFANPEETAARILDSECCSLIFFQMHFQ